MHEVYINIIGEGPSLSSLQMGCRAFIMFFVTLIMIRIAGIRTFGTGAAFDNVVVIMLGAILSRAVTGASPFLPVITAGLILCFIRRVIAWGSYKDHALGRLVKGKEIVLYSYGTLFKENMERCHVSMNDLMAEVRTKGKVTSLEEVSVITMERSGEISVIIIK